MKKVHCFLVLVILTGLLAPVVLLAKHLSPSFDCNDVQGEAEKLVCSDSQLASLDLELARIYTLALNNPALGIDEKKYLQAY